MSKLGRRHGTERQSRREVVDILIKAMSVAIDEAGNECDAKLPDYNVAVIEFMRSMTAYVIRQAPTAEGREANRRVVVGRLTDIVNELAGVVGMTVH